MSGLTDRIAKVIAAADPCYYGDQHDYDKAAEAVVAALNLTEVIRESGVRHIATYRRCQDCQPQEGA